MSDIQTNPGWQDQPKQDTMRARNGSPVFYALLQEMAEIHDNKSHDYASNENPFGNYHFAGLLSKLFDNADDAGFVGRIGEKLYRLANIENSKKFARNESIEDTEKDLCVIMALWIADRRTRRIKKQIKVAEMQRSAGVPSDMVKQNIDRPTNPSSLHPSVGNKNFQD